MLRITGIDKEGDVVRIGLEAEVPVAFFRDAEGKRLSKQEIIQRIKQWLLNRLQGGGG